MKQLKLLIRSINNFLSFKIIHVLLFLFLTSTLQTFAEEPVPQQFIDSKIIEKIGHHIPFDMVMTDDKGNEYELGSYFNSGQPVIINLIYYSCPMLCNILVSGLLDSIEGWGEYPGNKYKVLSISFDPRDTSETATQFRKKNFLNRDPKLNGNWELLTTSEENIDKIKSALGFRVVYDDAIQEFAHSAAIILVSPSGKISRYLYGIQFDPIDLKLATIEAKEEKSRSTVERVLLFCYNYNPDRNSYVLFAVNLMKVSGLLTIIILGLVIFKLRKMEK